MSEYYAPQQYPTNSYSSPQYQDYPEHPQQYSQYSVQAQYPQAQQHLEAQYQLWTQYLLYPQAQYPPHSGYDSYTPSSHESPAVGLYPPSPSARECAPPSPNTNSPPEFATYPSSAKYEYGAPPSSPEIISPSSGFSSPPPPYSPPHLSPSTPGYEWPRPMPEPAGAIQFVPRTLPIDDNPSCTMPPCPLDDFPSIPKMQRGIHPPRLVGIHCKMLRPLKKLGLGKMLAKIHQGERTEGNVCKGIAYHVPAV